MITFVLNISSSLTYKNLVKEFASIYAADMTKKTFLWPLANFKEVLSTHAHKILAEWLMVSRTGIVRLI